MAKKLTSSKAREILHDKSVHGQPLTDKQRRFFGAIAGGAKPYKAESGGWLDQYEQGGLILKKKTKDNFGKKANPNDVQAKTGPGYVGLAYDTTGRNYSPAWGGQFQMGGSLPGATGGMYARTGSVPRTINPAPENGPYAKKTKASAQNGKKVKEDSNIENVVEIFDPTGITSWDDVYRSYKKTGMSPETGLEIFGALPMLGKLGKVGKVTEAAAKTFAITGRQKRNAKAVSETLKTVGKYGPGTGRSTDAYQAYNQWKEGGSMSYYQAGLDFKPKTISQNGGVYDVLKQRMPSDATRVAAPIIPLTEKEKEEAAKIAAEGQRRAAERDRQILEERKLRASTKGDINVPGSFNIAEKARLFPESVGGLGQAFDEYVNPMYAIGSMADALGEAVAAQDNRALAMAAALTAGVGALGFDPLGTAVKNRNVIKNIPNLLKSPQQRIPTGLTIEQRLAELQNVPTISLPDVTSYTPPNVIGRLNLETGEITRTAEQFLDRFRNIEREPGLFEGLDVTPSGPLNPVVEQRLGDLIDPIEQYYQRNPRSTPRLNVNEIREAVRQTQERIDLSRSRPQQQFPSREELIRRANENTEMIPAQLDVEEMRRRFREVAEYEASAAREEGISNMFPPTQTATGPKFGEKDFKFDKVSQPGENEMIDPKTGTRYVQSVEDYDTFSTGYYKIFDKDGYITLRTSLPKNDPVLNVDDISFFNSNEKEAVSQFNKVMSNLPARVNMDEISTSMYSQPLMNSQLSRWANNQPGRIELKDVRVGRLNPFIKPGDFVDQIAEQFPKIQKSYKTLSETTGQYLPEPVLKAYSSTQDDFIPITVERLNTEAGRRFVQEKGADAIRVFAPKFKVQKNWQNGGQIIDPMGQWAYPGEITTIPGNDITMKGVNYDVLGVSNTGDKKLMKPGKNYKFDGEYVTEYPRGGWLDKYK